MAPFREAQISEQPLWGFSSSNPDRSQSRAEQSLFISIEVYIAILPQTIWVVSLALLAMLGLSIYPVVSPAEHTLYTSPICYPAFFHAFLSEVPAPGFSGVLVSLRILPVLLVLPA